MFLLDKYAYRMLLIPMCLVCPKLLPKVSFDHDKNLFFLGIQSSVKDWAYHDYVPSQVCGKCGLLGYYNYKLKKGICSTCKNGDNIATLKLPYACKLLIQVQNILK